MTTGLQKTADELAVSSSSSSSSATISLYWRVVVASPPWPTTPLLPTWPYTPPCELRELDHVEEPKPPEPSLLALR
jgi:hypothetical protein